MDLEEARVINGVKREVGKRTVRGKSLEKYTFRSKILSSTVVISGFA